MSNKAVRRAHGREQSSRVSDCVAAKFRSAMGQAVFLRVDNHTVGLGDKEPTNSVFLTASRPLRSLLVLFRGISN